MDLDFLVKGKWAQRRTGFGKRRLAGDDRCRGSLNTPSYKRINILINPFNCSSPPEVDVSINDPAGQDQTIPGDTPAAQTQDAPAPPSADRPSKMCPAPPPPQLVHAAVPAPYASADTFPASEAVAAPCPVSPCVEPGSAFPAPSAAASTSPALEAAAAPCPVSPYVEPGSAVPAPSAAAATIPASKAATTPCPVYPCVEPGTAPPEYAHATTAPPNDPLFALAMATAADIQRAPCLDTLLRRKQHPTLSAPPAGTPHPVTALLQEYATQGCPAEVGSPWPLATIREAKITGLHPQTCRHFLLPRRTP